MPKRETNYPHRLTVNLPAELGEAIRAEADRADESPTRTAREAIRIGFPMLRERRRKARRKRNGNGRAPSGAP